MELWHLGLCLLCAVIGVLIGVIVDIDNYEKLIDRAYLLGYKHGKEDGKRGIDDDER